jgi:hypothetical protein
MGVSSSKRNKTGATLFGHTRQPIFRPTEMAVLRDPHTEQTLPIMSAAARWNDTGGMIASSTHILDATPAAYAVPPLGPNRTKALALCVSRLRSAEKTWGACFTRQGLASDLTWAKLADVAGQVIFAKSSGKSQRLA